MTIALLSKLVDEAALQERYASEGLRPAPGATWRRGFRYSSAYRISPEVRISENVLAVEPR